MTWRIDVRRRPSLLLSLAVLFVAALIFMGVWNLIQSTDEASEFTLTDIDGKRFSLSDFRVKVVLLDFMATWCGPCRESMPVLKVLWEKYEGEIVIITIAVDPAHDTVEKMQDWVRVHNATWIHARDTANPPVGQLYKVTSIPTFVLIDKTGKIRYRHVGLTSEDILMSEISALLKE